MNRVLAITGLGRSMTKTDLIRACSLHNVKPEPPRNWVIANRDKLDINRYVWDYSSSPIWGQPLDIVALAQEMRIL